MILFVLEELSESWSLVLLALVGDEADGGRPLGELCRPILDSHKRHHD